MNIFIWMLAGATLGWASFAFLGFSEGRGKMASVVIGAFGGLLGGKMIAPIMTAPAVAGGFSMSALVIAAVVASVILVVANVINKRWGI